MWSVNLVTIYYNLLLHSHCNISAHQLVVLRIETRFLHAYLTNVRCVIFIIKQKYTMSGEQATRWKEKHEWVIIKRCTSCNIGNRARAVLVDRTHRQRLLRTSAALTTKITNFWLILLCLFDLLARRFNRHYPITVRII